MAWALTALSSTQKPTTPVMELEQAGSTWACSKHILIIGSTSEATSQHDMCSSSSYQSGAVMELSESPETSTTLISTPVTLALPRSVNIGSFDVCCHVTQSAGCHDQASHLRLSTSRRSVRLLMRRCPPLLPEVGIIWYYASVCQLIKTLFVNLFGPKFLLNIIPSEPLSSDKSTAMYSYGIFRASTGHTCPVKPAFLNFVTSAKVSALCTGVMQWKAPRSCHIQVTGLAKQEP